MKFVEATLIIPLTILISISLIVMSMTWHKEFINQLKEHDKLREKLYSKRVVLVIRGKDKLDDAFKK